MSPHHGGGLRVPTFSFPANVGRYFLFSDLHSLSRRNCSSGFFRLFPLFAFWLIPQASLSAGIFDNMLIRIVLFYYLVLTFYDTGLGISAVGLPQDFREKNDLFLCIGDEKIVEARQFQLFLHLLSMLLLSP
jgi:hypothetical protein